MPLILPQSGCVHQLAQHRSGQLGRSEKVYSIHFPDGEVAAFVVVELGKAGKLLEQTIIPMASALRGSLLKCLESLRRE